MMGGCAKTFVLLEGQFIGFQENIGVNNSRGLTAPGRKPRNSRTFRGLLAPGYCDIMNLKVNNRYQVHRLWGVCVYHCGAALKV